MTNKKEGDWCVSLIRHSSLVTRHLRSSIENEGAAIQQRPDQVLGCRLGILRLTDLIQPKGFLFLRGRAAQGREIELFRNFSRRRHSCPECCQPASRRRELCIQSRAVDQM